MNGKFRRCRRCSLAASLLLLVSPVGAYATVFTDVGAFEAGTSSLTVLDFEGIAPAGGFITAPDFSPQGVTFGVQGLSNAMVIASGGPGGPPSDFLLERYPGTPLLMDFSPSVLAAGFNVSMLPNIPNMPQDAGGDATVEAFNGSTLLQSVNLTAAGFLDFTTFVGFTGIGDITRIQVTLQVPADAGLVYVDNVAFGVPEPASLSLFAVALALGLRRRRAAH